jgi:hypothetical protein
MNLQKDYVPITVYYPNFGVLVVSAYRDRSVHTVDVTQLLQQRTLISVGPDDHICASRVSIPTGRSYFYFQYVPVANGSLLGRKMLHSTRLRLLPPTRACTVQGHLRRYRTL